MSDWQTMRALLAGIPNLDGARCKRRADLFERTTGECRAAGRTTTQELDNARREALWLCETCPALHPCRAYLQGLPAAQRPRGVVAGQVMTSTGMPSRKQQTYGQVPSTADRLDDQDREDRDVEDLDEVERATNPRSAVAGQVVRSA